jgi:signal transduction histidine kinase
MDSVRTAPKESRILQTVAPIFGSQQKGLEASVAARVNTLWVGFAGLLLMMAFAAFDAARTLQDLETTSTTLRRESRARDILLDRIRGDLQRSGTLARDYLLEPNRERAANLGREMEEMRTRSEQDLAAYEQLVPADGQTAFRALTADAQKYWGSLVPILRWQPAEREAKRDDYLDDVVVPRAGEAVRLVLQIADLNARDLDQAEQRIQSVESGFRRRVVLVSSTTMVVGLLVALVSVRRMKRLETAAETRYREAEETRREMKLLADRLVVTQEDERRSISRELHDEVGQSMSAMLVDLGSVESALPEGNPHRQKLKIARELAETSVRSIRDIALLLRPSMLDDLGLIPALNWQAREVNRRTGLKVKMAAEDIGEDIPEVHRTCVYRVVQEALQNCVKHAKATQVRVGVRRDSDVLSVSVQDDGVGFDPSRAKGAGLLGMEERVRVLGGQLRIDSQAGAGTVLSILLPLPVSTPVAPEIARQTS